MYFLIILKVAMKSLLASKLRSFLAVLGIIIGVGAVIAMLGIAAGARSQIMSSIQAMGTDLLVVRPGQRSTGGVMSGTQQNLTLGDAEALLDSSPLIDCVTPVVGGRGQIKYFNQNTATSIVGSALTYFPIRNFEIDKGRCFSESEAERMARVAVLGPTTAQNLMGDDDPVNTVIKINGVSFRVVGVLKAKGDQGWYNPDDQIIIPYTTAMKQMFGGLGARLDYVREIDIQGKHGADLNAIQDAATNLLRRRHRTQPDMPNDFEIRNQAEILETVSTVSKTFTVLLGTVAGISLFVGGIGIMNIMLVTVTERTREIGVRKAIGAKDRDILRQFLFEAMLMSCLGGLIGIGFGIGAAKTIGAFTQFTTVLQVQSIVMAMSFAAGVGIFFGYYPARRAAKLNPIDALRYE